MKLNKKNCLKNDPKNNPNQLFKPVIQVIKPR